MRRGDGQGYGFALNGLRLVGSDCAVCDRRIDGDGILFQKNGKCPFQRIEIVGGIVVIAFCNVNLYGIGTDFSRIDRCCLALLVIFKGDVANTH